MKLTKNKKPSGMLAAVLAGGIGIGFGIAGCGGTPSPDSGSTGAASTTGTTASNPSDSTATPGTSTTGSSSVSNSDAPKPVSSAGSASGTQFTLVSSSHQTLSPASASALEAKATLGQVSPDKKTLTFNQHAVRMVARVGPDNDMMSYRINGLRNPTIIVPAGATVKTLFLNTDGDMTHDLRFAAQKPPFPAQPDRSQTVGTITLPHAEKSTIHADDVEVQAPGQAGSYVYLCTMKGHAKGGMFGVIKTQ